MIKENYEFGKNLSVVRLNLLEVLGGPMKHDFYWCNFCIFTFAPHLKNLLLHVNDLLHNLIASSYFASLHIHIASACIMKIFVLCYCLLCVWKLYAVG